MAGQFYLKFEMNGVLPKGISTSEIAYNHCISNIMRVSLDSLYLLGPPIIELLDSVYYTIAGQSFTLNCSAMNDVDNSIFVWFKDNNLINENIVQVGVVDSTTSQLVIPQSDPDQHSGQYFCGV